SASDGVTVDSDGRAVLRDGQWVQLCTWWPAAGETSYTRFEVDTPRRLAARRRKLVALFHARRWKSELEARKAARREEIATAIRHAIATGRRRWGMALAAAWCIETTTRYVVEDLRTPRLPRAWVYPWWDLRRPTSVAEMRLPPDCEA